MKHLMSILLAMVLLTSPIITKEIVAEGPGQEVIVPEGPDISNITVEGSLTTGDPVTISIDITDEDNVSSAWLVYNWSSTQPSHASNMSFMRAGDMFSAMIINPVNRTDPLWYRIIANDTLNNWNGTSWFTLNITDNDPPTFLSDGSTDIACTGDAFGFVTNMDDNVGIFRASVNFTSDDTEHFNFSMCGAGNSRQTLILLPLTAVGNLTYRFWFSDGAGNEGESPIFTRKIFDNDPPYIFNDMTPKTVNSGEVLFFHFRVFDNREMETAWIDVDMAGWYQGPIRIDLILPQDGNFSAGFAVPTNFSGDLTYNATFVDTSGNRVKTDNLTVDVIDTKPPSLVGDLSDNFATTGEDIHFRFRVDDNIAISVVELIYKLPGEDWYTSICERSTNGDLFVYSLNIPSDMTGVIQYYARVIDISENVHLGDVENLPIFDNDRPQLMYDDTPSTAETGGNLSFKVALKDNVGVIKVDILYEIIDLEFIIPMTRTLPVGDGYFYERMIRIPIDARGNLTYEVIIMDAQGNKITWSGSVEIIDSILPRIGDVRFIDDASGEEFDNLTSGDLFHIEVDIVDNLDPMKVEFFYIEPESSIERKLDLYRGLEFTGTRTYNSSFTTPSTRFGPMIYWILVTDSDGESNVSLTDGILVLDNDPPRILRIDYPEVLGSFDILNITIEVEDNHKVKGATIFLDTGDNQTYFNMESEDKRTFTIEEPVVFGKPGPFQISILVYDWRNSVSYTFNITIIDDVGPTVFFLGSPSKTYPDDQAFQVKMNVYDMSDWYVEYITVISNDGVGFSIEDYHQYWDVIDFYFFPTSPGTWKVEVHLRDANDVTSIHSRDYLVYDNTDPYFQIQAPEKVNESESVHLEMVDYDDSSGVDLIEWTITGPDGERNVMYGQSVEFLPWTDGDYRISLRVEDQVGNFAVKERWISVEAEPEEPEPNFGFIVLIILTLLVGGLVLWLSVKDRLPTWLSRFRDE